MQKLILSLGQLTGLGYPWGIIDNVEWCYSK